MTDRLPADHDVRLAALDVSQSCIVQAPAGSGKTDLLIKRYLRLLAVVEKPEEILAITFTRKAAAEMRNRVLEALTVAGDTGDDISANERQLHELARAARLRDTEYCWDLATHPARLRIQTIDSFNAELTRQLPLLAKFGAQPQISERPAALYEEAVQQTLEELESAASWSGTIAALLRHLDNDWQKAHALLMAMLPRREQWLAQLHACHDRDYAEQALANEIVHQLHQLRAVMPREHEPELCVLACFAATNVDDDHAIAACREVSALPAAADALPVWQGLAELLLTAGGDWRKKPNKNQGFPAGAKAEKTRVEQLLQDLAEADDFRRRLHAVRILPQPRYDDNQWQLLQALAEVLPLAAAQLKIVFGSHGQVDFPEMAERALQALGDPDAPTDLGLRLDYRIRHILVDEFQDTSVIQHNLLKALTAGWEADDGRSLFLVGDPMQSIYRFREAEVGLFLETWRHGLGHLSLTPLQLKVNFRSHNGIVDWINDCFAQVLPGQADSASGAVPYTESTAWHDGDDEPAVQVHPQFNNVPEIEAQRVLELIGRQQQSAPDDSVAVLVQTRNHLAALVPLLRRRGLRYRAMEIERLGRQPVVQDLLALTRALMHPADRIAWLAVLRAPWCGLSRADLYAVAAAQPAATGPELLHADHTLPASKLSTDGRQRLLRLRTVMEAVRGERRRRSLRDSVETAWLALGGPCCAASAAALDDAAAYFTLLEAIDEAGDVPVPDVLQRELEQLFAPPDPDAADNPLQILTIHKAKGLEFDCVIAPGLGRPPRHDDDQLLLWQTRQREQGTDLLIAPLTAAGAERDPIYQFLRALDKERSQYERGRLLYVACTRACKRLHLLGHVNVRETRTGTNDKDPDNIEMKSPAANSALSLLWPQLQAAYQQALAQYDTDTGSANEAGARYQLRRLPSDWQLPPLPASFEVAPDLADSADMPQPIEFSWAGETARVTGIVVHRLLQRIARDGADAWPPDRITQLNHVIAAMLLQQGLPIEHQTTAAANVMAALKSTLADKRGCWLLDAGHGEARSELALSRIHHGRLESVVVDRTFVDAGGVRWIIDYKTGVHGGSDREAFLDQEQLRYQPQLQRYAEFFSALEQRPIRLGLYFPLLSGWREWPL